ncbi:uncharacterized protein [Penaeus vannamei]|uniref:uncharacterized protein n=1 Tax=Penaeus vannamei TaxID=6689 RepID=UPI00387F8D2C
MKIVIATVVLGVVMGVTCAFSTPEKPQSVVQTDTKEDKIRQDGKRSEEKFSGESLVVDDDEIHDHGNKGIVDPRSIDFFHEDEVKEDAGHHHHKTNHHDKNHEGNSKGEHASQP